MTFSNSVKDELLDPKSLRERKHSVLAHGLISFGKSFSEQAMGIATENLGVAKLYASLLEDFLGLRATVAIRQTMKSGKTLHTVWLPEEEDRLRLLNKFPSGWDYGEALPAFLAGAFLACGNVTDPEKAYHLELLVREEASAATLRDLLNCVDTLRGARLTTRRGCFVVYYKECAQIEDFLTFIGASRSSLRMIDVEMLKTIRNSANRATNCETANIDKLVNASAQQVEDIRLLFDELGEASLPDNLLAAARLRLEQPDYSLRELAEGLGVSRSGAHHRLEKLSQMAAEIRREKGETADE